MINRQLSGALVNLAGQNGCWEALKECAGMYGNPVVAWRLDDWFDRSLLVYGLIAFLNQTNVIMRTR